MSKRRQQQQQDQQERIERLTAAASALEQEKQSIYERGEVAPPGCVVARYQVRQQQKKYWYYKLQASEPTFPKATEPDTLSKYKHLGKAGSAAHIEAVMQVVRRTMVDEIQRTIETMTESLLDVGFDSEQE